MTNATENRVNPIKVNLIDGSCYVCDNWAASPAEFVVGGPFETATQANAARLQMNIAEDCQVGRYNVTMIQDGRPVGKFVRMS